jgi:isocitrate dehydrogenase
MAEKFTASEKQVVLEIIFVKGRPAVISSYHQPGDAKASAALRPSKTLNVILTTV